jgi:hypothetical protein
MYASLLHTELAIVVPRDRIDAATDYRLVQQSRRARREQRRVRSSQPVRRPSVLLATQPTHS